MKRKYINGTGFYEGKEKGAEMKNRLGRSGSDLIQNGKRSISGGDTKMRSECSEGLRTEGRWEPGKELRDWGRAEGTGEEGRRWRREELRGEEGGEA